MKKTLILSKEDIQSIIGRVGLDELMDKLIERLQHAIHSYDSTTVIPIRSGFNYQKPDVGLIEWMPIYSNLENVSIKVVGYHPNNPTNFNLPTIVSTVSSYETSTGHLNAIMDGVLLTALRTGAASAVASKYLAKLDSQIIGLVGCGAQSITQLHAISRLFDLKKVLIYDIDESAMKSFKERSSLQDYDLEILESSIEEIISDSDIVCTATSVEAGSGPLFKNLKVKESQHVNAIGSDFPGKIELPLDYLEKSFVVPDFKNQALIEGECQNLEKNSIGPELFEILQNPDQYEDVKVNRTVFDSTGWALEDKVALDLFVDLADEFQIGKSMEIEILSKDAKNPYGFLMQELQEVVS